MVKRSSQGPTAWSQSSRAASTSQMAIGSRSRSTIPTTLRTKNPLDAKHVSSTVRDLGKSVKKGPAVQQHSSQIADEALSWVKHGSQMANYSFTGHNGKMSEQAWLRMRRDLHRSLGVDVGSHQAEESDECDEFPSSCDD